MDLWIQIFFLGKITFFAGGERDHREVENKDIKYSKTAMANNQFWSELTGRIGVLIQNFLSIPHSHSHSLLVRTMKTQAYGGPIMILAVQYLIACEFGARISKTLTSLYCIRRSRRWAYT